MKHSPTKPHGWARPFIKQLLWSVTFINSRRFLRMNVQAKQKIVDFVMKTVNENIMKEKNSMIFIILFTCSFLSPMDYWFKRALKCQYDENRRFRINFFLRKSV